MHPPKLKWIAHENHQQYHRKSGRQAAAWPLNGMFFVGYHLIWHYSRL